MKYFIVTLKDKRELTVTASRFERKLIDGIWVINFYNHSDQLVKDVYLDPNDVSAIVPADDENDD